MEPVYGSKEFLKFLIVVDLATTCTVFVLVYITYASTAWATLLYTEFYGFHGIAAGLLVAVKQVMGEQEMTLFGTFKLSFKVCMGEGWGCMQPTPLDNVDVIRMAPCKQVPIHMPCVTLFLHHLQYIPTIVILLVTAVAAGLKQYEILPFLYFGAYSAWIYLRFFQHQQETGAQVRRLALRQ